MPAPSTAVKHEPLTDDQAAHAIARLTSRLHRHGRKDLADLIIDAARPVLGKGGR